MTLTTTAKCTLHDDCQVETQSGSTGSVHIQRGKRMSLTEWNALMAKLENQSRQLEEYRKQMEGLSENRTAEDARLNQLEHRIMETHFKQSHQVGEALSHVADALEVDVNERRNLGHEIDGVKNTLMKTLQEVVKTSDSRRHENKLLLETLDKTVKALDAEVAVRQLHADAYKEIRREWGRFKVDVSGELARIRRMLKEQHDNFWDSPEAAFSQFRELERRFAKVEQDQVDQARRFERRIDTVARVL